MNEPAAAPRTVPPPEGVLAALLEHGNDLLAATDAAGRIVWANDRFRMATGLTGEVRADLLSLLPDEPSMADARAQRKQMHEALRAGSLNPLELHWRTAAGRHLSVRARVLLSPPQTLWIMQDVSEVVERTRTARHQAELLDIIRQFGRLGVWERDPLTGEGHWDEQGCRIWGVDPAQGTPSFEQARAMVHPDDRHLLQGNVLTSAPGLYSAHYRIIRPDGEMRRVHSLWEVKQGSAGGPGRVVGIVMDDTEVYEMVRSLSEANTQLKLAEELGRIAVWRFDPKTDTAHFSDHALAILGRYRGAAQLTGEDIRAVIHPDDRARVHASVQQVLRSSKPVDVQARYRADDGSWRTFLTRRVAQRGPDGAVLSVIVVALDVSEQVEQQRQALALAHRLELTAAAAGLGIWWRRTEDETGEWNAQMFALVGRDPALGVPAVHEWIDKIVHPDDREILLDSRRRLAEAPGEPVEYECRAVLPDGQVRWLLNRARIERWADAPMIFGVTMDVTASRLAERALRHADQRAALAARSVGIGTWEESLGSGVRRWDEQMFHLRGLPGMPHPPTRAQREALLHPDDAARVIETHDAAMTHALPSRYEFRVRLPDGSYRWLASRSMAILDDQGRVERRVGVNWDITERKNAELAQQQRELAERASHAKSQLLSRMSHELRTPLNAVLGFTQLLELEVGNSSPESQRQKLGQIRKAGAQLLSLIDDMLDLSSLDSGQLELHPQAVDLSPLLTAARTQVEALAARQQVGLQITSSGGRVVADADRLRQVLVQLLSNAIKFSRPLGEVRLETFDDAQAIGVRVVDSGRILSAEQAASLFEPFNPLGQDAGGIDGAGIGLAIAKGLIERMGGNIAASSQSGTGTQLEVRLPRAAPDPAPDSPATTPGVPETRNGRLLYIEDNAVNVLLVEELVRTVPGLTLVSEATGGDGVAHAIRLRPDLVLVDIQLPDFDGFEVLRRLRADARTADIPCIALSANAMADDISRAREMGFADYWTKPIDFKAMVTALERWFPPSAQASTH